MERKDKILLVVASLLIVIGIVAMFVKNEQKKKAQMAELRSERIASSMKKAASIKAKLKKKESIASSIKEKNKRKPIDSVTVNTARENISNGFNAVTALLQNQKMIIGDTIDTSSIPAELETRLNSTFADYQLAQNLADLLNYSTEEGSVEYRNDQGDLVTETTPKPTDSYIFDKLDIQNGDQSSDEYHFTVDITFHGGQAKQISKKLQVNISKEDGKITQLNEIK